MATHQVEEYYVYMSGLIITEAQKEEIEKYLSNEGWSNYEFQDGDTSLVIEDIDDQSTGETLEYEIEEYINKTSK